MSAESLSSTRKLRSPSCKLQSLCRQHASRSIPSLPLLFTCQAAHVHWMPLLSCMLCSPWLHMLLLAVIASSLRIPQRFACPSKHMSDQANVCRAVHYGANGSSNRTLLQYDDISSQQGRSYAQDAHRRGNNGYQQQYSQTPYQYAPPKYQGSTLSAQLNLARHGGYQQQHMRFSGDDSFQDPDQLQAQMAGQHQQARYGSQAGRYWGSHDRRH